MSSRIILQATRPVRGVLVLGRANVQCRGFQVSTARASGLKESSQNPDSDKHKRDSLEKQRQGHGHWKPELASDSEEALHADRDAPMDPHQLAERTKRLAEETSKAGTSMRDGL